MKSVTLRTEQGEVLLKILHKKSGEYNLIKHSTLQDIEVEVRDEQNHKVMFNRERE